MLIIYYSVQGILFVASLIDYNQVLHENKAINSMYENCNLFHRIVRLDALANSKFFLIFTKDDILKNLLLQRDDGLIKCFGKNDGIWRQCLENDLKKMENITSHDDDNTDIKEKQIHWIKNILDNNDEIWDKEIPNDIGDDKMNESFEEYHASVVQFLKNLFFRRYKDGHSKDEIITHVTVASKPTCVQHVFTQIEKVLLQQNGVTL